ncbi:hypothetical protein [Viridibacillus arvi]|uniref:hypothetical protein n=1 Tax=Viridibacillus arvi TaxID=263475 RepID=UPI0034CF8001
MPKEKMEMSVEEIKNAMLNPFLIKHLQRFNISNQGGEVKLIETWEQLVEQAEKIERIYKLIEGKWCTEMISVKQIHGIIKG